MTRIIAHDIVNDIAIIQTSFCLNVRYGLEVTPLVVLQDALDHFAACQRHAVQAEFDKEYA